MRIPWDDVFDKNVIEFLNVISYIHDKKELEKRQMEDYNKKIKHYG